MAWIAAVAPYLQMAGTVLGAVSAINAGKQQKGAADFQAVQLDQNAGAADASAQRRSNEERRQARLASSRLQALAQGGGGDPTIIDLQEDIAGEGEYRALSALYEGKQQSDGLRNQAAGLRATGRAAQSAGYMNAATTVLSSAGSMYEKYGAKKPGGYG